MINTNDEKTMKYDLHWPGRWIEGEDRDWANGTFLILRIIESEFIIAVASFLHYKPITHQSLQRQSLRPVSKYKECMNTIYARSFVMSLDLIGKLLNTLDKPPDTTSIAIDKYKTEYGHLKFIRDSVAHFEDRGRGLDRNGKKLRTPVVPLGRFNEKGFDYAGNDGNIYHIDITEEIIISVRDILQDIINGYSWNGFNNDCLNR